MANATKILLIVACILALIGWIVALAGVAKLNDICNDEWNNATGNDSGTHKECSDALSYHWWGVWFGFFLTVVIIVMAIMGKAEAWASTLQAFCAACLSVTMIDADNVNDTRNAWRGRRGWGNGDYNSAVDAALAGFVIVCIALFLIIIFLGFGGAGVNPSFSINFSKNKTVPADEKSDKPETKTKTEKTTVVTTIKTEEV